jgi:hypothetical protein
MTLHQREVQVHEMQKLIAIDGSTFVFVDFVEKLIYFGLR